MRDYIDNDDRSQILKQQRKGRLELYTGPRFKKFTDERGSDKLDTCDFENQNENKSPEVDLEKVQPFTKRTLVAGEEENPSAGLMYEGEKRGIKSESKEYAPFDDPDPNNIFFEDVISHTVVKNMNIYSSGNEL